MWQEKLGLKLSTEIKGYTNKLRSYGDVKCFKGEIDNIECAILLIERAHYGPDVIEIIPPIYLREELNLKNGDIVKVKL